MKSRASFAAPLRDRTYRRLFVAQVVALLGTGLTSVALALLAFDLAGSNAGVVLGVALALKMVAYVVVAPVVAGLLQWVPRRRLLVTLDLVRAGCAVLMPFVTQVWQALALIVVLNACSAGFTPTFQAAIPDILRDEERYTHALSLSRLAYDLESLLSPALAALLLLLVGYQALFALNGVAFLVSAGLVLSVAVPAARAAAAGGAWSRISFGTRRYLAVPRLRALLALSVAVAAASAMVIVNTVVLVREELGMAESAVAIALGAAGAGSMVTALALPRLLRRRGDRTPMLVGGGLLAAGLAVSVLVAGYAALLLVWFALGVGLALVQTPAGRLVRRSAREDDGPALFAAQFSLSHACWLVTYPVAGVAGAVLGVDAAAGLLALLAAVAALVAVRLWSTDRTVAAAPAAASPAA